MSAGLYYAVRASTFRVGQDAIAIVNAEDGRTHCISVFAGRVLAGCQGAKTLAAHAAATARAHPGSDEQAIATAIGALTREGLLRPLPLPQSAAGSSPAQAAGVQGSAIDAIAIVTADRPRMLQRCLHSVVEQCQRAGRSPRLFVIDGSRRHAQAIRAVVDGVRPAVSIEYVGLAEAARLRQRLVRAGIPEPVLATGLSPGSIGNNRNLALLLTAGSNVLMIDDDVISEPWMLEGRQSGVTIAGHAELREWQFFRTRRDAVDGLLPADTDIVSAHGEWLGRSLTDLMETTPCDLQHACEHLTHALAERAPGTIRVTMAGLAGDSARYCPRRLLFLEGTIRHLLTRDRAAFEAALAYREIRHLALRTIVSHEIAGCASYCMAIGNVEPVPPFMPEGRGEDTVFGAMLGMTDPRALMAHLPIGVVHDSDRPAAYGAVDRMISARQTRLSEVMLAIIESCSGLPASPSDRLSTIARHLRECGQIDRREFLTFLSRTALHRRCRQMAVLESSLRDAGYDDGWRAALEEYRQTVHASLREAAFFMPVECQDGRSPEAALAHAQRVVRQFGELLLHWSSIWRAAKEINTGVEWPMAVSGACP
jgi:hypothetical protein